MKLAAVLILLTGPSLLSQTPDRTQPPPATALRSYKLPAIFETQLPNGLTVLLVNDARVPLVTLRLAFACGNRRDPADLPGVAAAVADTLTKATATRGAIRIGEALDDLGGSISAASGADHIVINGSIDASNLTALVVIAADVARNAELRELDLEVFKQQRRQLLAQQHAQPVSVANEEFRSLLFGGHPYAHVGPTTASLQKMDRKALVDYRDKWMVPNNAFLILVGRLPARADMVKLITDTFGSWPKKELPDTKPAPLPVPPTHDPRLILVDRPGAPQVAVRMGKIAATQRDPDYFAEIAASVLMRNTARGGGAEVRTEPVAFDEAGILASVMLGPHDGAADAIRSTMDRQARMSTELVRSEELANAKDSVAAGFFSRIETQAGLADELMVGKLQKLPAGYLETWSSRLESVKPGDIQAAAKKFMSIQDNAVVVVGDAAKIQPALLKIGKFEVVK